LTIAAAAALGLATVAFAQQPAPTSPPEQDTQQPALSPEPNGEPTQGTAGETSHDNVSGLPSIVGLEVTSPAGEMLGTVITVVASTTGRYAILSTGTDTATAVPYEVVAPMVHEGKVVMDRTKLQNSPQVAQADLHDKANTKWRQQADTYWAGQSPGRIRSATPGTTPQPKER